HRQLGALIVTSLDIELRALQPLGSLIEIDEFPLAGFAPSATVDWLFDALYLVDPVLTILPAAVQLDTGLAWEGELALTFPGTDLMTIVLARGAVGWTALWCRMIVGPEFEFTVYDV